MAKTPNTAARCATCRHWDQAGPQTRYFTIRLKPLPGEDDVWNEAREAREHAVEALYGECQAISLLDGYEQHDPDDVPLAFCKDGSDYRADLYTRGDFGCAMWAAKEQDHNG